LEPIADWDPTTYSSFADQRLRPVFDLLARVPLESAHRVIDLGCGSGSAFAPLLRRFPACDLLGLDSSPAMLEKARETWQSTPDLAGRKVHLQRADIGRWAEQGALRTGASAEEQRFDLIFSNAALHWLPSHSTLLPALLGRLRPGGVLAVQMPRNWGAPSHALMRRHLRTVNAPSASTQVAIAALLQELLDPPVHDAETYDTHLSGHSMHLDIWETEYLHRLVDPQPPEQTAPHDPLRSPCCDPPSAVLHWVRSTALRPIEAALSEAPEALADFLQRYGADLRRAYPRRPDGITLFPFRRLFIVAQRAEFSRPTSLVR
jgi:trans-aconitate 2-methyltransferase